MPRFIGLGRYADRAARLPMPAGMAVQPAELGYTGLAYRDERVVGHIALRHLPGTTFPPRSGPAGESPQGPAELEIKRMFVSLSMRGQAIGRMLLTAAEHAATASRASSSASLTPGSAPSSGTGSVSAERLRRG